MPTIYENNLQLDHDERKRLQEQDLSQKEIVLKVLSLAGKPLTDADIHRNAQELGLIGKETPLTSIRRARSNLKKAGRVEEALSKKDGGFGVKTNTWRIKSTDGEQGTMFPNPKTRAKYQNGVTL